VTNILSFEKIKEVIKRIETIDKSNKLCKILVGNKTDEEQCRTVTVEMIRKYLNMNENFIKYKDVSVKTRDNISDLLDSVIDRFKFKDVNYEEVRDFPVFECEKLKRKNYLAVNNVYKIILLGDGTVGKSSFFKRYFFNDYDDKYTLTMGINEKFKFLKINDSEIKLQLWDTAGQERFRSLPRKYYQHADGILLLYDVTNRESFNNVTKWMKDINENSKRKIITYLAGNKIDLIERREVTFEDAMNMARQYNTNIFEISCKFDINVTEVLKKLSLDIYEKNSEKTQLNSNFHIDEREKRQRSLSCCIE